MLVNPSHLLGHTGALGTHAFTGAGVTALSLGFDVGSEASTIVDDLGLLDDEAVLDQLADVLAGVSHGNFVDLIGVQPNLTLATLKHAGSEAVLKNIKVDVR